MENQTNQNQSYYRFAAMMALSFIAMYILMYAMIDEWSNVFFNINKFYMAALMTAPMGIFEIALMAKMYPNKKWNLLILGGSAVALVILFIFIRQQTGVGDKQFLRSMIPHHSSAILMCDRTELKDQEIKDLCKSIIQAQREEIDQMKAILKRMD